MRGLSAAIALFLSIGIGDRFSTSEIQTLHSLAGGAAVSSAGGTTNAVPKWTNGGSRVVGDSTITDDGTTVTLNTGTTITTALLTAPALSTAGNVTYSGTNGATMVASAGSEQITLNTGASFTDSSANLLPANSIIDGVVCRITTTITTAVNFQIGDSVTAGRFVATDTTMTANHTAVGTVMWNGNITTTAAGPTQAAAAKLRITLNANPGAGVIRCEVFARVFTPPTS